MTSSATRVLQVVKIPPLVGLITRRSIVQIQPEGKQIDARSRTIVRVYWATSMQTGTHIRSIGREDTTVTLSYTVPQNAESRSQPSVVCIEVSGAGRFRFFCSWITADPSVENL